ncbi:hypothetical protein CKM354_001011700 [Cercospora kikuchii]|uniref:Uncharacterized protein n=1 Tax=Cercospora kikuchii TaxID=84275 RepID=A0A9P3CQW9_9PEZI|nr:uncharacterized protein CKM354_001011700 [Cercospora kikuchii]GIZ47016.1 hypothetical protein CKM354_001011700 [Cercospora kikuchii]
MPPHNILTRRVLNNCEPTSAVKPQTPPPGDSSPTPAEAMTPISFGTSAALEMSPTSLFASGQQIRYPLASTTISSSTTTTSEAWPDHFPDVPRILSYCLAGGLGFGIVTAICLLMIMYWPRRPSSHSQSAGEGKSKGIYRAVPQGDVELQDLASSCSSSTSHRHAHSIEVDSAKEMLLRQRKKELMKRILRVDTTGEYRGLGIVVPREDVVAPLCEEVHDEEQLPEEQHWKVPPRGRGEVPYAPTIQIHAPANPTNKAPASSHEASGADKNQLLNNSPPFNLHHHRSHHDLETGMLHNATQLGSSFAPSSLFARGRTYYSNPASRSPSASSSSASSAPVSRANSTLNLLLEKGEDAINFAARKLAKMMYDQVNRDRDVEADLLLPVRAEEMGRERSG